MPQKICLEIYFRGAPRVWHANAQQIHKQLQSAPTEPREAKIKQINSRVIFPFSSCVLFMCVVLDLSAFILSPLFTRALGLERATYKKQPTKCKKLPRHPHPSNDDGYDDDDGCVS